MANNVPATSGSSTSPTSSPPAPPPAASQPSQINPAAAPCKFFRRGYCRYGSLCRFQHTEGPPVDVPRPVCRYWRQGWCRNGNTCRFSHQGGESGTASVGSTRKVEDSEDEEDERMRNCGFTDDQVLELACQGVKPWDDDAWDVLAALNDLDL